VTSTVLSGSFATSTLVASAAIALRDSIPNTWLDLSNLVPGRSIVTFETGFELNFQLCYVGFKSFGRAIAWLAVQNGLNDFVLNLFRLFLSHVS